MVVAKDTFYVMLVLVWFVCFVLWFSKEFFVREPFLSFLVISIEKALCSLASYGCQAPERTGRVMSSLLKIGKAGISLIVMVVSLLTNMTPN